MNKNTHKIAICGVMGALATTIMLLGGIFPLATFCAPAIAGLLIMPIAIEYGNKSGLLLYFAISLLSLFIAADKEMAFIFVFFLGYYPILKTILERIRSTILRFITKFIIFNVSILIMYSLLLILFPLLLLQDGDISTLFFVGLIAMANVTFLIYDFAVAKIVGIYCSVWRSKLMKHFR